MFSYIVRTLDSERLLDINWSKDPSTFFGELVRANNLNGFPRAGRTSDSGRVVMRTYLNSTQNRASQEEVKRSLDYMRSMPSTPLPQRTQDESQR